MRLIDADALRQVLEVFTEKDTLGHTPLQLCDAMPAASPWHRVEDGLPEMSEIASGHLCSETLVLYDDETWYMDIGYVMRKPNGNEVYWFWGLPLKTPTHWMPIEPPKEDA